MDRGDPNEPSSNGEAITGAFTEYRDRLVGTAYFVLGNYERTVEFSREALRHPNVQIRADIVLVAALTLLGRQNEAETAMANMLRKRPGLTCAAANEMWGPALQEFKDTLLAALRKADLPES